MPALQAQQINRCTGADGNAVYSDRRCQDLEAVARPATPARAPGSQGLYRDSCLRRLSELVDHLQSAIAAGDANQLASVYQWSGVSNAGATHILERLETIARRPLLDISPVYAAASAPPISTAAGAARFTVASGSDGLHTGTSTGVPADARRRPHALRLQQGDAAPQTELQLHRQYGCFWITL